MAQTPSFMDSILPFTVTDLDIRGRVVKCGEALQAILARHNYPDTVSAALAELMLLTILLGSNLKFTGKISLQTNSEGPINLMLCDFSSEGFLRSYARFDKNALEEHSQKTCPPLHLLGKGVLAITLLPEAEHQKRYQAIVGLDGSSFEEIASTYFNQSEQIPTIIKIAAQKFSPAHDENSAWYGGALFAQILPHNTQDKAENQQDFFAKNQKDLNWEEAQALLSTIEGEELFSPNISPQELLYRLFHQHEVHLFPSQKIEEKCSCSTKKCYQILQNLTAKERAQSMIEEKITMDCAFCGRVYLFKAQDFPEKTSIKDKDQEELS